MIRPSVSGVPTLSSNSSGAAPVPPSDAVDDDEVRRHALGEHGLADRQEVDARADAELEPGGLAARELPHPGDERHQLPRGREDLVGRGAHARLPDGHAPSLGDLRGHLGPGQDAADAGLGALAELELTIFTASCPALSANSPGSKPPSAGAGPEVPGTELPHQVAAVAEVVLRQAALAGVLGEPALGRTPVQGQDRVGAQGTEAHPDTFNSAMS